MSLRLISVRTVKINEGISMLMKVYQWLKLHSVEFYTFYLSLNSGTVQINECISTQTVKTPLKLISIHFISLKIVGL